MKKVIRTLKGGKGGQGRAKRFMKKSSSGAEYGKLNSNVKAEVSARVEKKKTKYTKKITDQESKTQILKESIQKNKKKGFLGRIKNLLTFKQTRIDWKTKTIKQTQNKLTKVEELSKSIDDYSTRQNEATKKELVSPNTSQSKDTTKKTFKNSIINLAKKTTKKISSKVPSSVKNSVSAFAKKTQNKLPKSLSLNKFANFAGKTKKQISSLIPEGFKEKGNEFLDKIKKSPFFIKHPKFFNTIAQLKDFNIEDLKKIPGLNKLNIKPQALFNNIKSMASSFTTENIVKYAKGSKITQRFMVAKMAFKGREVLKLVYQLNKLKKTTKA